MAREPLSQQINPWDIGAETMGNALE
jgi:hypothetical protein